MSATDRALAAFEPITLREMDGVSLQNRVDTKYVFADSFLPELLRGLAHSYRVLEVQGVRRTDYASLYFDTPASDCFRDHHRGKAGRYKFRMRSYASSGLTFFEVKHKTNRGRTVKRRVPIDQITPAMTEGCHTLARECVGRGLRLNPQLWTRFSRLTLVGLQAPERVTIDTGLRFDDEHRQAELGGVVVAEVKQERDSRNAQVRQSLRRAGIRPLRVSKYCLGATLLRPGLKSNLFRAKLKRLSRYA